MPDWLWQAIIANWLWELLVLAAGGVFAWLRHRNVSWLSVLFYGFAGCTLMSVLVYTLLGRAIVSREQPHTTPENVETNIKAWADRFSLAIQKQKDDKFSFVYSIGLPSGRTVLVGRAIEKNREGYLQFQGTVVLGQEHEAELKKLSPSQLEEVMDRINLELSHGRFGFTFIQSPTSKAIVVSKMAPISASLDESTFLDNLNEIDAALLLTREAVRLSFNRYLPPAVTQRPQALQ